jgi:hypothetical protein
MKVCQAGPGVLCGGKRDVVFSTCPDEIYLKIDMGMSG